MQKPSLNTSTVRESVCFLLKQLLLTNSCENSETFLLIALTKCTVASLSSSVQLLRTTTVRMLQAIENDNKIVLTFAYKNKSKEKQNNQLLFVPAKICKVQSSFFYLQFLSNFTTLTDSLCQNVYCCTRIEPQNSIKNKLNLTKCFLYTHR